MEVSDDLGDLESNSVKWLEYPLLLHYWYLAGLLPISKLDNCLAIGSLTPSGEVVEPIDSAVVQLCDEHDLHLIASKDVESPNGVIDGKDLFGSIAELRFQGA